MEFHAQQFGVGFSEPDTRDDESADVEIIGVPTHLIDAVWPACSPLLDKALQSYPFDAINIELVYERLKTANYQLWVCLVDNQVLAACASMIGEQGKLYVLGVGGSQMGLWVDSLWQTLIRFGRSQGCRVIGGYGRKGWIRVLKINPREQYAWETDIEDTI